MNKKLTYTTDAFAEKCPDCGAEIQYVQFGGPRVGYDNYPGFQFVMYKCGADYYFDKRVELTKPDRKRCPTTLKTCAVCKEKVSWLIGFAEDDAKKYAPFCSEQCAVKWALANMPKVSP